MADLETLIAFAAATIVFAFIPGPGVMYVAAQTLARGRSAGIFAAFGLHAGGYVFVFGTAFGLSSLFAHVPAAYTALKLIGAFYLAFLGWKLITAKSAPVRPDEIPVHSVRRAFLQSLIVQVTNPKAALFFIAFLPQFVDPAGVLPVTAQLLVLGLAVNLTFLAGDVLYAVSADFVIRRAGRSPFALRATRVIGGSIMIGLGARLALSKA